MADLTTYRTMTPGGIYGKAYPAATAEAATAAAEADGYEVLDVMDDLLVIPDDPRR